MKKRIFFSIPDQFGYSAGYYQYARCLNEHGYEVYVLSIDRNFSRIEEINGVTVFYEKINDKNLLLGFKSYINLVRRYLQYINDDTIVILKYNPFIVILLLFLKNRNRIFLDVRTGAITKSNFKQFLLNSLLSFESLFFKHIYVLSLDLAKMLHLNMQKVIYLPLGADEYSYLPKKYNLEFNLLYVGTFNHRKIHETVMGYKLFRDKYAHLINSSYTIIGYGDENEIDILKKTISDCGLNNYVHYIGRKKYTEFHDFFEKANVGISYVPKTRFYNNQPPTKIYEYLLAGLICIATSTDANKKIVNTQNAILCNDTTYDFFLALEKLYQTRDNFSFDYIKKSMKKYLWNNIVDEIIIPSFIDR